MSSLSSLQGASGKLLRRIHRACRPSLDEPNAALNLEICDLINEKQGNLPREATVAIVKLINSRDPQVSELALSLLDYLVKNCGYPVHLQISRKEFLNELVKRFPERPPPVYTRTQRLILGTIAEWVQTICKTSRYKEDLGYIRDMHRLLRSKGYEFPAVKKEDAAVLNPSDNLKSIEEIQREERIAQSAKLQELIRRGRPQDLKEANELMKIMSGFKHDETLEETRQRVNEDVEKVSRKAEILDEMLNNATNAGTFDPSDETIAELISALRVAQPKLQVLVQEESDDQEQVGRLLSLNDKINSILQKADLLKDGDVANASKVKVSGAGFNLIDFDDEPSPAPSSSSAPAPTSNDAIADLLGDLGGLSFEPQKGTSTGNESVGSLGGFGAINLLDTNTREQSPSVDILSGFSSPVQNTGQSLQPSQPAAQPAALDPFQFDFASMASQTSTATTMVTDGSLKIDYVIDQKQPLALTFKFSNTSPLSTLSKIKFSIAVTKSFDLTMLPPSGSAVGPGSGLVTQKVTIKHKNGEPFNSTKIKFKCDYEENGTVKETSGVATITF